MKKTLIAILALGGFAVADDMTYVGPETTTSWNTTSNWQNNTPEGTHTYAQSGDTINISGANVTWSGTQSGVKFDSSTVWNITDGANVTLGTQGVRSDVNNAPRFDGVFNIDADSTLTLCAGFVYDTNNIFGTLNVKNILNPGTNKGTDTENPKVNIINFGESGIINLLTGSANGIEGNDRILTLGAVLANTATDSSLTETVYTVETRYLFRSEAGSGFNPNKYGTLTVNGGTVTGLDNTALTYTTDQLTATAADFGKYTITTDGTGIYMTYVKATVPEPATATLSLLALAGLAARRRRH